MVPKVKVLESERPWIYLDPRLLIGFFSLGMMTESYDVDFR